MPHPILRLATTACLILSLADPARAAFSPEVLKLLDRPFEGEMIALSPDGRHVAFSLRDEEKLSLVIANLDTRRKADLQVTGNATELKASPRLLHLQWVTADRLIFVTAAGDVIAVNADGTQAFKLWQAGDDGVMDKMTALLRTKGRAARVFRGGLPPRLLPGVPGDPEHILLESRGLLGLLEGSNLFRINIRDGGIELMNAKYVSPGVQGVLYRAGRMLYDRQGSPRLIRPTLAGPLNDQPLYYTAPGKDPRSIPGVKRPQLDTHLDLGKTAEFTFTAENYLGEHSFPLAFDYDPNVLYFASNVGSDTYGVHALDLTTKVRTAVLTGFNVDLTGPEPGDPDRTLVFDESRRALVGVRFTGLRPMTAWLDPELGSFQTALDREYPRQAVEILQWSDSRSRLLARISSEDHPGRYVIADTSTGAVEDLLVRAPWLREIEANPATEFTFETPAGVRLTGYVTLPAKPWSNPPPLIVYCPEGVWDRARPGFHRETQMLASLGAVTLRLNYRGTTGFGRKHLAALRDGVDLVPLADIKAAIDWLASRYQFDRERIVLMGQGYGGFLALRGVQLYPEFFRAAISVNAPTSLKAWATPHPAPNAGRRQGIYEFHSLVRATFLAGASGVEPPPADSSLKQPILVIEGDSGDTTMFSTLLGKAGLGMTGTSVERLLIKGDLEHGSAETRAAVFERIDRFLNEHLYSYEGRLGELRVVPDASAPDRTK
jgi:pimeloyl-ACP methyl ester carboxylesterase